MLCVVLRGGRAVLPVCLAVAILGLAACATRPASSDRAALAAYEEAGDPLEPLNRYFFDLTNFVDFILIRPLAEIYRALAPAFVRRGIGNSLSNLSAPVTFVNDVLQGEPRRAAQTLWRFGVNSTIGVGGVFDVAARAGVERHGEDFGQTLAVYGVPAGPYIFIPFMGPSSVRDVLGSGVDTFISPTAYTNLSDTAVLRGARTTLGILNGRANLLDIDRQIQRTSVDPYTALRSFYRQNRLNQIRNGRFEISDLPEIPDELLDFEEEDGP